jgi:hypothetical protein
MRILRTSAPQVNSVQRHSGKCNPCRITARHAKIPRLLSRILHHARQNHRR